MSDSTPDPQPSFRLSRPYDDAFKAKVLAAVLDCGNVKQTAVKFGIHITTIYCWIKDKRLMALAQNIPPGGAPEGGAEDTSIAGVINPTERTFRVKRASRNKGPFIMLTNADSPSSVHFCPGCATDMQLMRKYVADISFCPKCGTNVKAVAVALDTYSQLRTQTTRNG